MCGSQRGSAQVPKPLHWRRPSTSLLSMHAGTAGSDVLETYEVLSLLSYDESPLEPLESPPLLPPPSLEPPSLPPSLHEPARARASAATRAASAATIASAAFTAPPRRPWTPAGRRRSTARAAPRRRSRRRSARRRCTPSAPPRP